MSNNVKLYKRPSGNFELEINSLLCKDNFSSTGFPAIMGEVNTYLTSITPDEGVDRLSSTFTDPSIAGLVYLNPNPVPASFDGTNSYLINYIDLT